MWYIVIKTIKLSCKKVGSEIIFCNFTLNYQSAEETEATRKF